MKIITISREFGSGGRELGKRLAEALHIPCYDHELIDRLAEESGLSKEYITNESEYASHSSWTAAAFSSVRSFGVPSNQDYLWAIQRRIILELGQKENCVIVGRCATNILKDKSLKIFIHAPFEERVQNVIRRTGREEASARKLVKKMDKERKAYYEYFTDSKWLDMTQYDLCIDSSRFSMEQIIEIVKRCL